MTATTAIFVMVAGCGLDYMFTFVVACAWEKITFFWFVECWSNIFWVFQTFISKATGKIKPTKSDSDYYVFSCAFSVGLVGQLCIFLHFEKQFNSMFAHVASCFWLVRTAWLTTIWKIAAHIWLNIKQHCYHGKCKYSIKIYTYWIVWAIIWSSYTPMSSI